MSYLLLNRALVFGNSTRHPPPGIGCVGWVRVAPKPAPYVKEMHDQALFYGNRVLKEYKGKDE